MDLPGGGSVVVENGYAYVGHIDPPHGTSIIDVQRSEASQAGFPHRRSPRALHSHKVRVSGNVMLINYERYKAKKELQAGLKIFDISDQTQAAGDRFLQDPRQRRASFHLRRPLCVYFADNGRL